MDIIKKTGINCTFENVCVLMVDPYAEINANIQLEVKAKKCTALKSWRVERLPVLRDHSCWLSLLCAGSLHTQLSTSRMLSQILQPRWSSTFISGLKQHSGPAVHLPFRARVIVYLAVIWSCHATKQHQNPTIILKTLTVNTVSAQSLCHLGWEEDLFKVLQSRTAQ